MSHYISSLLIEPVVRQARRFSRASVDDVDGHDHRQGLARSANGEDVTVQEDEHELNANEDDSVLMDVIDDAGDSQAGSDREGIDHGNDHIEASDEEETLQIVEAQILEAILPARRHTLQSVVTTTSANPHHRLSTGLLSDDSSMTDSTHTNTRIGTDIDDQTGTTRPEEQPSHDQAQEIGHGHKCLPEDDGMGQIRRRIIGVQRTDSSNEVKARMIHDIMTERHVSAQTATTGRMHSPTSDKNDRPHGHAPHSPSSVISQSCNTTPPTSSGSDQNFFRLTANDLEPTYFERKIEMAKDLNQSRRPSESDDEPKALGCAHYKRNIKLQCSACQRWYTCRFCHDAVEDHMLNRRATQNMLCMLCGCAQPASEECVSCGVRGAWYYCDVCKLWDDDPEKSIYHCNDCGICRVGQGLGKDFFHCKTCCVCMSVTIQDTHRCIERSTDSDCPICGEYMFTSPETVVFMRCGHSIHHSCYWEHMKSSYKCPICSRSIVNMDMQFARLERSIRAQPMPEEFRDTKARVYCNDCTAKTSVGYHWLGLKCAVCDSYNTAQLSLLSGPSRSPSPEMPQDTILVAETPQASRPTSRGRLIRDSTQPYLQPRAANSLPTSLGLFNPFSESLAFPQPHHSRSGARSASPAFLPGSHLRAVRPHGVSSDESMISVNNDDDAYSDVDFWGGESLRAQSRSPRPVSGEQIINASAPDADDEMEDIDESDNDDDDLDELDEDDEDDDDEPDPMEIMGHR